MILEIILLLLICYFTWYLLKPASKTKLLGDLIPGPTPFPIIGNLLSMPISGTKVLPTHEEFMNKYGPTFRVWVLNKLTVSICTPEDIEVLTTDISLTTKPDDFKMMESWLGNGIFMSTGQRWHDRRKAITPSFHFQILEEYLKVFNENSHTLLQCLEKECDGKPFNIQPYVQRCALDIICESAMGTKVNAQLGSSSSEYLNQLQRLINILMNRIRKPWLHNDFIYGLFGDLKEQTEILAQLKKFSDEVILEKTEELKIKSPSNEDSEDENLNLGIKKKSAFLEHLLKLKLEGSKTFITDRDIEEEVNTFLFGGQDTTMTAASFAVSLLASHQDIQDKVYEELKGVFTSPDVYFTINDIHKLKYLERVIKESLRLYPSVPGMARDAAKDIKLPSGYTIPEGTLLIINMFCAHRNKKYFPNPHEFNPDNFLPEVVEQRHPFAYIPFSAGSRNCIGQKFAMLELKVLLARLLLTYKLEATVPECKIEVHAKMVIEADGGHFIRITKR